MNKARERNFGLTKEEFNDLSAHLGKGDERLFEVVFLQHFQECLNFLVREDNASTDLAYDATMEAFYAFRTKVEAGKITYGNLRFLLTRMARQYYLKSLRKEHTDGPDQFPELAEEDSAIFTDEAFTLLRAAWQSLGDKCRKLLYAYYYRDQSLKEIAEMTAKDYAGLRKRKQRCVVKLRKLMSGD